MKVKEILDKAKVEYKLIKLKKKAENPKYSLRYELEIDDNSICKTIVMRDKKKNYFAVLIKSLDYIDKDKVKKIMDKKISVATHDDVLKATGVRPGEVCPLLVKDLILIDKEVMKLDIIHMGSGDKRYGLEMKLETLLKLLKNYKIADIRK